MKKIAWLDEQELSFPDVDEAVEEPNGLLAAGGDLSTARLVEAYRNGIFPWYDDEQPLLWWSPNPRCVIYPDKFKPSRSLAKRLKKNDYTLKVDHDFAAVIDACRFRHDDSSTWITEEMTAAYVELHRQGIAHSIECYIDNQLVGGLYGLSIGNLFFGESMFHRATDASKIAFAHLMEIARANQCPLVDCQIANPHLLSLGAVEIPREEFISLIPSHIDDTPFPWADLTTNPTL